jgi:hypothetical protein
MLRRNNFESYSGVDYVTMLDSLRRTMRNFMVGRYSTDQTSPQMKLYGEQFAYGHREVLLKYCNLPSDLIFEAHLPHGKISPNFLDPIQKIFDPHGNPVLQLLWRDDSKREATELGISNVQPIGATFLYALANEGHSLGEIQAMLRESTSNFDWPAAEADQRKYVKRFKSIVYMPMHSWDGDVRKHLVNPKSPLLGLPPERITVLLGFLDFCDPVTRNVYMDLGWKVTCAGARSSKVTGSPAGGRVDFLPNLYSILKDSELVVSDEFTTGLFYAMAIGRKVGILNHSEQIELVYSSWQTQSNFNERVNQFRNFYNWLHGDFSTSEEIHLAVSTALGINSFRVPEYFLNNVGTTKFFS